MSETGEHAKAPVTGVVLAGGRSRRMGGGDKGLLELAGKPMLRHVIDRLAPQVSTTVINANGDPQRFAAFALPVVADTVEGFVGPLAGVLAGMRWSRGNVPDARWIVTAPGDAPLLPLDLVERMMEAVAGREDSIALAQSGGEMHPVVGLWPIALMQDLEEQLRPACARCCTGRIGTARWPWPSRRTRFCGLNIDPFYNANTPQELGELRAMLRKAPS